jgi:metal-responsive CopG/Arc/MetJ family transcriptional regulator
MANIKTAVSLREQLFRQTELLARDLKLSRSRLFAVALEEFIERRRNRDLLDRINKVYSEKPDAVERKYLKKMRQRQRKMIDQW